MEIERLGKERDAYRKLAFDMEAENAALREVLENAADALEYAATCIGNCAYQKTMLCVAQEARALIGGAAKVRCESQLSPPLGVPESDGKQLHDVKEHKE